MDKSEIANFSSLCLSYLRSPETGSKQYDYSLDKIVFKHALTDMLTLSIDEMLRSENGIERGLAMLDRRLGKRRLRTLALPDDELPLVRTLHALRCEAEGITPQRAEEMVS